MAGGWNSPAKKKTSNGALQNNMKLKIVFLGTGKFGEIVLRRLQQANYSPISYRLEDIQKIKPDLVIVANFGKILSRGILDIPCYGCINLHPSLLPKYRGPSPIQTAILNGDKETGVTIFLMDAKIDHGPILAQKKTVIGENENAEQLLKRLAILGADLLIDTIPDWIEGKIKLRRQDEKRATYTKLLTREDGEINWKKPVKFIERQIRALYPWPGTYTFYKRKRLKILKARLEKNKLIIKEVQLEGKKPMSFEEFLRGHRDFLKNKIICSRILI